MMDPHSDPPPADCLCVYASRLVPPSEALPPCALARLRHSAQHLRLNRRQGNRLAIVTLARARWHQSHHHNICVLCGLDSLSNPLRLIDDTVPSCAAGIEGRAMRAVAGGGRTASLDAERVADAELAGPK